MMACDLSELAFEKLQVDHWILFSVEVQIVPELADLLVEETDCTLVCSSCQWTEYEVVSADILWLQTECAVSDQTLTVVEHFEGDWLIERVTQGNLC